MDTVRTPRSCRWAKLTFFLPYPAWLGAWDHPWTCEAEEMPRPIESTDACATCPFFAERGSHGAAWSDTQFGG